MLFTSVLHFTLSRLSNKNTNTCILSCLFPAVDCAEGTYGPQCDDVCQCYGGRSCEEVTGTCPTGGCEAGYYGRTCGTGR